MDHHRNPHHRPDERQPSPPPPQVTHTHHTSHNPAPAPPQVSHHTSHNPSPAPPQVSHHTSHNPPPPPQTHHQPSPPPPQVTHTHHTSHNPSPAPPQVSHHTSHNPSPPPQTHHQPSPPVVQHVSHTTTSHHETPHKVDPLANKPTVKVYCKAKTDYALTIRDGKVILAPSNPSDPLQHWIKDEKYSTRVKDEEGLPSFALVNKGTGQAMKHSIGATHPVQLIPYNDDHLDESILWTLSKDTGEGYKTIRMVNNIRLNVDGFNGDKEHGGVQNGTKIVLWEWAKGENQRWKIVPY